MHPGTNCISVCVHYESFRAKPYLCPAGVPTIGYGSTRYPNGMKVRLSDPPVSEKVARDLMMWEITNASTGINQFLKVTVTQAQYDALVSFGYNCGVPALKKSTLMRLINAGGLKKEGWQDTMTKEFKKWVNADGRKLAGLVSRRATEAHLFCNGIVKFFN